MHREDAQLILMRGLIMRKLKFINTNTGLLLPVLQENFIFNHEIVFPLNRTVFTLLVLVN